MSVKSESPTYQVPCPACSAKVGEPCIWTFNDANEKYMAFPHNKREIAYADYLFEEELDSPPKEIGTIEI